MNLQKLKTKKGFTLIELLVVILILAILMAIALPLYLSSIANAELKTCRTNMQTIGNAYHAGRVAARTTSTYPVTGASFNVTTAVAPDLLTVPVCPSGAGVYQIAAGTGTAPFNVDCVVSAAHGVFQYGIDNN